MGVTCGPENMLILADTSTRCPVSAGHSVVVLRVLG